MNSGVTTGAARWAYWPSAPPYMEIVVLKKHVANYGMPPSQKYSCGNGAQITDFEEFWRDTMPCVKKGDGEKLCPLNASAERALF